MKFKILFWCIFLVLFTISCVPFHKMQYFTNTDELNKMVKANREQKKIAAFDNLYIKILSTDEKTANMFNYADEMRYNSYGADKIDLSYLVDENGDIAFPFVGKVNVLGLTLSDASTKIGKALTDYVPNTAVIVKFYDNHVAVVGEVQRSGEYSFTKDKITIYEAIALAGGLTRYGNRKKVVLIREENDTIQNHVLNLSDAKIIGSDFYYIQPRDVVVVEPIKAVSWSFQNVTYTTVLSTITTLVALLYIFKK